MDELFYAFAVLVFAAAILLAEGAYLWWAENHGRGPNRVRQRLRMMSGGSAGQVERVSILKQRRFARDDGIDVFLRAIPGAAGIDKALQQAGSPWLVSRFLAMTACLAIFALLLASMRQFSSPVALAMVLAFSSIPYWMLVRARIKRIRTIEIQLPDAADFFARALRSGHAFSNVLQMAGSELPEPLASEFRLAHEEINYGVPIQDALYNLAGRVPLADLRYLVIAVLIQRESGGNLAEILTKISCIIRERLKLLAQIRVLSSEGRMSAWILALLPFAMLLIMSVTSRAYISFLWIDPAGKRLLAAAVVMVLMGGAWLRKLAQIRV